MFELLAFIWFLSLVAAFMIGWRFCAADRAALIAYLSDQVDQMEHTREWEATRGATREPVATARAA